MKKRDIYIICGVLSLAVAAFFAGRAQKSETHSVAVYVGNELYGEYPLTPAVYTVDQGDGRVNVVEIFEDGVCMQSSTCENQNCVHQGKLTPQNVAESDLGAFIICLPNGVSVELK